MVKLKNTKLIFSIFPEGGNPVSELQFRLHKSKPLKIWIL